MFKEQTNMKKLSREKKTKKNELSDLKNQNKSETLK